MMKKYIYIILGLLIVSSCSEELLDKESTSVISAKQAFSNSKAIQAVRTGLYSQLAYASGGAPYTMIIPILSDILGNDMVYGAQWYQSWVSEYSYKVIPRSNGPYQLWTKLYYVVEITNTITTELSKATEEKVEGAEALKAEAMAIRGMMYVDIARFFGKAYHLDNGESKSVPYFRDLQYDPTKPGVIAQPERSTMKEIYRLAIEDLTQAIPNLPELRGNENIMNKNAAHALLSRIYLDMHKYAEAKEHAQKAILNTNLMTASQYLNGDLSRVNPESILCFSSDKNKYSKWRTITSFFDNYAGMGDDFLVNRSLVDKFSVQDIRRRFFVPEIEKGYKYWTDFETKQELGYKIATESNPNGAYAYGKLPRKDSNLSSKTRGTLGLGEFNYIRSSEMILVIAECDARLKNESEAKKELLKIQKRAISGAVESTKTGQALIEEILEERRKELFGEGHSHRDMLRLGKGLNRDGSHSEKISLKAEDERFIWPIPKTAVDRNPNLTK